MREGGKRYYRSYVGLLLAAVVGSVVFAVTMALVEGLSGFNPLVFIIAAPLTYFVLGAGPATLFIGLPIFLWLRERLRPTMVVCTLLGATIGSIPALVVWGLLYSPSMVGGSVVAGAAGGLVFWWVAHDEIERNHAQEA